MAPTIPVATYRLQLTKQFGFRQAAALVPYLKALGISHLYASPFLAARPGSTHGYDIIDHNRLSDELGGEAGFSALAQTLRSAGLGLILDFVPNHMGIGFSDNEWWLDVLEWGQRSPHAASFDIDWDGLPYRQKTGVLLPILGRPYGEALRAGEIDLKFDADAGSFAAWYFEHKLPINPQRYAEIIKTVVSAAGSDDTEKGRALISVVESVSNGQGPTYETSASLKGALARVQGTDIIQRGLAAYDGKTDTGWRALHRLLERQAYHLAYWRVAFSAINYRRFFDINDLAGVRPEHPATFAAMHRLVARLIAEGELQGIRLDHIDGLRDPAQYARRLRELIRRVRPQSRVNDIYVVVEKILGPVESLPPFRGVDGTTGYERLNLISRVLLQDAGLSTLEEIWRDFSGVQEAFSELLIAAKRTVLQTMLASEFSVLARALARIAAGHLASRDYTIGRLREALQAYVLEFPVYRTYITASRISADDSRLIESVISRARAGWGGPDPEIFDFLCDALTTNLAKIEGYSSARIRNFAMKVQQFTGPLMAKSLEDTAFYRYHRLLALNEVGGEPANPELSMQQFHYQQIRLLREQPNGLIATATHDTKRGEDARTRILSLAENPDDWRDAVFSWKSLNDRLVRFVADQRAPSFAHEYMLYQTLIGAWEEPDRTFIERIQRYAIKAMREGKQQTSWTAPNEPYEKAVSEFIELILEPGQSSSFIKSIREFCAKTSLLGALNSLSQVTLKLSLPGVPDFFQGTELWDFSLVDPDNRRTVDFASREHLLGPSTDWAALAQRWQDGEVKFALIQNLLRLRQRQPDLFRDGTYEPVPLADPQFAHALCFARKLRRNRIVVIAGRVFSPLTNGGRHWPTDLSVELAEPLTGYHDVLRGNPAEGRRLTMRHLPVGIYMRA
ncbi:MAG: malto-oligosyltrehalose synthase [Pseudolabrys sp.]|nr:malto-oligosyltrehalose synthase [Pseudolabrys sp.]